ncbi:MAG: DUF4395 domain-containing protein [Chloroflexota bacterium]|nr:DUF4395 domain-containing protein [Chloroflexota bacterium]
MTITATAPATAQADLGISVPIVTLNRWVIVVSLVGGFLLQQPLISTVLLVVLLGAVLFGPRGSLIFQVGKRLLARYLPSAEREDRRLMRFNNSIAVLMLALAQVAFALGGPVVGWVLCGVLVTAAGVALAGFCLGCYLFYQFKLHRYRLLGTR